MYPKLALIALCSFAICALCLGGAFALGGNAVGDAVFNFDGFGLPRCDITGNESGPGTRSLPWNGNGDSVSIALPANTHYQAGSGDRMVVTGDPAIISHIRVRDGVVDMDCRDGFRHFGRVEVTLPGRRTFRNFRMLGSGNMQLSGLSQPEAKLSLEGSGNIESQGKVDGLRLEVDGSGTIESQGQTDNLHVGVNGSGKLRLAGLAVKNADVDISGSGKVDIAPQDSLNVDISGSGTIYLRSEPKSIKVDISGSGRIVHPDGAVEDRHERHARAEGGEIGRLAEEAANGRVPDPGAPRVAMIIASRT
ncbi:MAG: head GIN domain-containing protein [Rhizomicrobium sp.]